MSNPAFDVDAAVQRVVDRVQGGWEIGASVREELTPLADELGHAEHPPHEIDPTEHAQDALTHPYVLLMGKPPTWSETYGVGDALKEMEAKVNG